MPRKICSIVLGVMAVTAAVCSHAVEYTIIDLGNLDGGTYGRGMSINEYGWIAGYCTLADYPYPARATLWDGSSPVDIETLGGTASRGYAINDDGLVVGFSTLAGGESRAFLYDGTSMTDLGTLGGIDSSAWDINDLGQVVGWADTPDGVYPRLPLGRRPERPRHPRG